MNINQTSAKIDQAVTNAVQNDIIVVTAAGNFGPELSTIGSPGINPNAITVGSTFNNPSSFERDNAGMYFREFIPGLRIVIIFYVFVN